MPPSKRRRTPQSDVSESSVSSSMPNSFNEGAIVRIKLENFMTYSNVELKTGPYLNMVLGPNGTGKSALVCAIILGLSGDASTTGRSGCITEYIKFGCDYAYILIELYNSSGPNNYIVERKILSKNRGKGEPRSEWKLNGRQATQTDMRAFIASLNIKVDNLCQFLPQERVVEFCKMNSKQLLENTEKAAGDIDMFNNHKELIELSQKIRDYEGRKNELAGQVEVDENLNERLAEKVERLNEKKKCEDKMKLLERKKPWIEFEEVRTEFVRVKAVLEKKKQLLENFRKKDAPMRERMQKIKNDVASLNKRSKEEDEKYRNASAKVQEVKKIFDKLSEKCNQTINDFKNKVDIEEERRKTVINLKNEIIILNQKLRNLKPTTDLNPEIDQIAHQIAEVTKELKAISNSKTIVSGKRDMAISEKEEALSKFKKERDIVNQRLDRLKRTNFEAFKTYELYKTNKGSFNKEIYPPIMTQINVKSLGYAKQIETCVPYRDLMAFVCEDVHDLNLFRRELEKHNIRVNMVVAPSRNDFEPKIPISRLARHGFRYYLSELFTAPGPVYSYLCSQFNLHDIPYGPDVDEKIFDANVNIRRFFSDDFQFSCFTSRYDGSKITETNPLKDPRFLTLIIDEKKMKEAKAQFEAKEEEVRRLEEEMKDLDSQMKEKEESLGHLRNRRKELIQQRDEEKMLRTRLSHKVTEMKRKEKEGINLQEEKREMKSKLHTVCKDKCNLSKKLIQLLGKTVEFYIAKLEIDAQLFASRRIYNYLEEFLRDADKFEHINVWQLSRQPV